MLIKNIKINSQFVILVSLNCCECVMAGCMRINMSLGLNHVVSLMSLTSVGRSSWYFTSLFMIQVDPWTRHAMLNSVSRRFPVLNSWVSTSQTCSCAAKDWYI